MQRIPTSIKFKFIRHFYQKLDLVGYKHISFNRKIRIIELYNYTRIWILPEEIKLKL